MLGGLDGEALQLLFCFPLALIATGPVSNVTAVISARLTLKAQAIQVS
jgi:hypothetical protein